MTFVRPYHVAEAIAGMFLCPLKTLHYILLVNQLALGTLSEHPRVVRQLSTVFRETQCAAVIFVGQPEPGLLSMLFVSLCFCRNLCIPIWLTIKPSSRNMWQIVSGLYPICAKWRICCLLYLLYISCRL